MSAHRHDEELVDGEQRPDAPQPAAPVARTPAPGGPLDAPQVLALQRGAGNAAVARMVQGQVLAREPGDDATPKEAEGGSAGGSATVAPPKEAEKVAPTPGDTKVPEAKDGVAPASDAGKESEPAHPPPARPKMDLAGGLSVLNGAYGEKKTFSPGQVKILDQADFEAAYDAIYGSGRWSWQAYVVPTYGNLNGFAHNNVNYINKTTAGLHTVVHEMLHNNVAADWRGVVGSRWDEGTTEVLTQEACAKIAEPAPVCYPGESPVVREALAQGLPLDDLIEAYLNGGAQAKIADWVDKHCTEPWAKVKGYMEANNWAAARAALQKKPAGTGDAGTPAAGGTTK